MTSKYLQRPANFVTLILTKHTCFLINILLSQTSYRLVMASSYCWYRKFKTFNSRTLMVHLTFITSLLRWIFYQLTILYLTQWFLKFISEILISFSVYGFLCPSWNEFAKCFMSVSTVKLKLNGCKMNFVIHKFNKGSIRVK